MFVHVFAFLLVHVFVFVCDLFSDWEFLDAFGGRQTWWHVGHLELPSKFSVVTTKSKSLKWRHTSTY